MMHVWVVDNPDGAFAEGLDKEWVRAYHAEHGRPRYDSLGRLAGCMSRLGSARSSSSTSEPSTPS